MWTVNVILVDDLGRQTRKTLQNTVATLADALTAVGAWASAYVAIADLGIVQANLIQIDYSEASAAVAGSNIDTGAAFKVALTNGGFASHHIPGLKQSLAIPGGGIDVTDADILTYFGLFEAGGSWRLSDGESITSVVSGQMDK